MYLKEFNYAKKIVKQAYKKIIKNKSFRVDSKGDNSLVTTIDINTENFLINSIRLKFLGDNFLTEENYSENVLDGRTWVIDPIDGTTNFSNGLEMWSIQLAFIDENDVKFSIMYFPVLKKFFSAYKGKGVFLNGKKLQLNIAPMKGSISQYIGSIKRNIEHVVDVYNSLTKIIQSQHYCGCASYGYAEVLQGKSSVLIAYNLTNKWDILPGEFMCLELGILKHIFKDYKNGTLMLYTNHNEIVDKIKEL